MPWFLVQAYHVHSLAFDRPQQESMSQQQAQNGWQITGLQLYLNIPRLSCERRALVFEEPMVTQEHREFGIRQNYFCSSRYKSASLETRNMWITMEMDTNLVRAFSTELSPWQIHQSENFLWENIRQHEEDLRTDTSLESKVFKLSLGGTRFRSLHWISSPDLVLFSVPSFPFK